MVGSTQTPWAQAAAPPPSPCQEGRARTIVIGIDFDNTIVSYDAVLYHLAREQQLITAQVPRTKKAIRDAIRLLPNGEHCWQRLQGTLYGTAIAQAPASTGVTAFLRACRRHHVKVYIISHKTAVAKGDPRRTNLRTAALAWLQAQGFFAPEDIGLGKDDVYFEATREAKLARIGQLGCTHFIDDLAETLLSPAFPLAVERLLYDPHHAYRLGPPIRTFQSWSAIHAYFFGPCC